MKSLALGASRLLAPLSLAALWIAATGLVLMTAFVALQVWGRYVMNATPTWTEPAAINIMAWFIFIGGAVGVREGYHLGFDVLLVRAPGAVAAAMRTVSDVVVLGFGAGMAGYGLQLTIGTWTATLPSLGLPGGFDYIPLVAGGALVTLFTLERIALRLAGLEHAPEAPAPEGHE